MAKNMTIRIKIKGPVNIMKRALGTNPLFRGTVLGPTKEHYSRKTKHKKRDFPVDAD